MRMQFADRRFLMLQGPHGPFLAELAAYLRRQGARVWRAGLNAGDESEWRGPGYIPVTATGPERMRQVKRILLDHGITDLLVYGDKRAFHAQSLVIARALGLRCHILEEGYLRPHWITYERRGSNQRSPAAARPIDTLMAEPPCTEPHPQATWGALRHHAAHGALYHLRLLLGARRYPAYRSHRGIPVRTEAARAVRAALCLPLSIAWRNRTQARVLRLDRRIMVLLMQLEHDSALGDATGCVDHEAVLRRTMAAFAVHAAPDLRLVVKMHPLETRQRHLARMTARLATEYGLSDRLTCIPGGRLAPLLDCAMAVVTVNSTAGQQALWRGLPLFALGPSVYDHDALLPQRDFNRFMANPIPPDPDIYARFRAFLFRTSQVTGSFYAPEGRRQAIEGLLERMARNSDPYDKEAAVPGAEDHDTLIPARAWGQVMLPAPAYGPGGQ